MRISDWSSDVCSSDLEGFTVYRDQSFSADQGSAAVKRIEDVRALRAAQFPAAAGPLAHPIRPDSNLEIAHCYTATIYNKHPDVIRLMPTTLDPQAFRPAHHPDVARFDSNPATHADF